MPTATPSPVPKAMSTADLDAALNEFNQNLSSEQKVEFESAANRTPSVEAVVLLTDEIIEKSSTRKSHVLEGRMRVVLEAVQQFSSIGDSVSSVNPAVALVWRSVKIVVQAALHFASYFEKLSKRFAQLSTYCPRLSAYEKLFRESVRIQTSLSNFYAVFVKFCTRALEVIQEKGTKRFVKSLWKDFKGGFGQLEENVSAAKAEVDEEIKLASDQKVQQIHKQLQIESKQTQIQCSHQLTEIEGNRVFSSQHLLALAETKELRIQKIIKEEDRTRVRLRDQIFSYDYTRSQNKACRTRCQGTAVWLFGRAEFKKWNEETLPIYLWCSGSTGCGKTILTGHIVEQMTKNLAGKTDTVIAYYFFDSTQKESLLPRNFLRSMLHQVLRIDSLNSTLQQRLKAIFIGPNGSREPEIDELEKLVLELSNTVQKVIIIVDGINEVEQDDQKLVLRFLKTIQQSQAVVKLFVASRPEVDIPVVSSNGQLTHISIRAHDNQLEIDDFIELRVEKEAKDGSLIVCKPAVIDKVKNVLKKRANGMFLWADLQIKAICDICENNETFDQVPEVLEKLPKSVIDIYSQALQRVLEKPDEQVEIIKKIFKWVVCARRSITIDELHDALTTTTGQKSWREPSQKFRPSTVSKLCGNLIVFDDFESTFSLAHHTFQAFLKSPQKTPSLADFSMQVCKVDHYLGEVCVTYLGFTDFQESLTTTGDSKNMQGLNHPALLAAHTLPGFSFPKLQSWRERLRRHPGGHDFDVENQQRTFRSTVNSPTINSTSTFQLLEYCKTNWYHHCHAFPLDDTKAIRSLTQLLKQPSLPFSWQPWGLSDNLSPFPHWPMFTWAVHQVHIPILWIWQGLVTKIEFDGSWKRLWLTSGDSLFLSACTMANTTQIDLFCNNLIEFRPAIELSKQQLLAGVVSAAALGHITVIERLLQRNADVSDVAARSYGRTALQAAAENGHLAMVERLLQQKADVNVAVGGSDGRTALQAAAAGGHLAVVKRLLHEKADVNGAAARLYGRTALQAAAEGGHLAVVERLLQQKADVNAAAAESNGRTALQAAAGGGHLAVVETLLEQKPDVNAAAAKLDGRTALQAAAAGGHLTVVERLLHEKADVNAGAAYLHDGRTALQAAAAGGHLAVVERLLEQKAVVNTAAAVGFNGRTALQAAAAGGHLDVVERLLQQKANVNAAAAKFSGRTALQAAAEGGHLTVVERLLQQKADVNVAAARTDGRTALQAAAGGGHLAVIEILLQQNADVNAAAAKDSGRTALQAAAEGGHLAMVEILLQQKADVNFAASGSDGRTALQAAAEGGHLAVVERLLQQKANVNVAACGSDGRTALQAAAAGGHLAVVERLLEQKADVNAGAAYRRDGRTALQAAAAGGYLAVVERLLQQKADVNAATAAAARSNDRTALQAAAEGGHLAVVERLLQQKANVNAAAAFIFGRTALQAAAGGGHIAVVERLLQQKADVDVAACGSYGRTALQAAAEGGHLAVVESLLQQKSDVNAAAAKPYGRTALQAAAGGGHLAVVEILLEQKADVNAAAAESGGKTALQAAAGGGHLAVVERLLQQKADVNAAAADRQGRTALGAAAEGGHLAVVERLLQQNADVNTATVDFSITALRSAVRGGHLAVVERLLQQNADVEAGIAEYGRTTLQAAAGGGHLALVERLLQQNADVNAAASDRGGRTALQAAAGGGHLAVVERLLQQNADVNAAAAEDDGRTALQAAAGGGHLAVVERLLQQNADVNAAAAEEDGRTALQAAAGGGHLTVVERLLQENADVNAAAAEYGGKTALQAAVEVDHLAVAERLRVAGARELL